MKKMLKYFTIFFSLIPFLTFSQELANFKSYSVKDGLSDNRVYNIIQDDRGFIWIGTANGLNFFDGSRFTIFNTGNSILKDNQIYEIKKARTNELLLATGYGAILLDTRTAIMKLITVPSLPEMERVANTVHHVGYTSKDEIVLCTYIGAYVLDRDGNLIDSVRSDFRASDVGIKWLHFAEGAASFSNGDAIITTKAGFYFYDYLKKKVLPLDSLKKSSYRQLVKFLLGREPGYIYAVNRFDQFFFIDNISFSDSIYIIDVLHRKKVAQRLPFDVKDNIRWDSKIQFHNDSLLSITTARQGYYLFSYNASEPDIKLISGEHASNLFSKYILQDRSIQFWIATETGFLRENNDNPKIRNIPITTYLPKDNYHPVSSVYLDNLKFWVGGYSRESGLLILDTSFRLIKKIDFIKKLDKNFILSIVPWSKDTMLIGTKHGAYFVNKSTYRKNPFYFPGVNIELSGMIIQKYFRDSKGLLWLSGGQTGGVWKIDQQKRIIIHYNPGRSPTSIPLRSVGAFAEDENGNIWMVHWKDGLVRWNRNKERFDTIINYWPVKELTGFNCSGIVNKRDGEFWVFINSYGLAIYNIKNNSLKLVVAISDRADDNTNSLLMTQDGKLCMNLRHSIQIYDAPKGRLVSLSSKNGLPDESKTGESVYYDKSKNIVAIGYSNTFSLVDVSSIEPLLLKPEVFITSVNNLRKNVFEDYDLPVVLSHKNNDLQIRFAISNIHQAIQSPVFEYRLSDDENWKYIGTERSLNLNNVVPGSYKLQIRMAGEGAPAQNSAFFSLKVLPPFNKTVWFYLLFYFVVAGIFFLIYRIWKRQRLAIQNVRNKISTDLHDDLGSRLTNIRFLSTIGKERYISGKLKENYLIKISEEALASSEALDEIVRNMKIHKEDIEDVIARMRHYAGSVFDNSETELKMNFDNRIVLKKMNLEKRRDLFLAFKEILNNIRKHAEAKTVTINFKTNGGKLFLEVKDDGIGFDVNKHTDRDGIKNIQTRVNKWGGIVQVNSEKDKGTIVAVNLPI